MRLHSVTLQNYRIHRELTVTFDAQRNLIGGPNESGKSTLAEAIHRVLFLKAKGNTELHRAMVSRHGGHPEVELKFEAEAQSHQLIKRFGNAGTTTLNSSDGGIRTGDDAEMELLRLLKTEGASGRKGAALQWAHLWVWQGQSGGDPTEVTFPHQAPLLQQLQQHGPAVMLQSDKDTSIAAEISQRMATLFTQSGKPKAGSDLERATSALDEAQIELATAQATQQHLENAITALDSAQQQAPAITASLANLQQELGLTEKRASLLVNLRQLETRQSADTQTATDRTQAAQKAQRDVTALRAKIIKLESTLQPKHAAITALESELTSAQSTSKQAEADLQSATDTLRTARQQHDLALAYTTLFQTQNRHTDLQQQKNRIDQLLHQRDKLALTHAQCPAIDNKQLKQLHKKSLAASQAKTTLQAMAAGVEIIVSDQPVSLQNKTLEIGKKHILTEDSELKIGHAIRLQLTPGGGTSLAEARRAASATQSALQTALDGCGVASLEEASRAVDTRAGLQAKMDTHQAELDGLNADSITQTLTESTAKVTAAKSDLARLTALTTAFTKPNDLSASNALVELLRTKLAHTESEETRCKQIRDRTTKALTARQTTLQQQSAAIEEENSQLTRLRGQEELLIHNHGDDNQRATTIAETKAAQTTLQHSLKETRQAIDDLHPDQLEIDQKRIQRALDSNQATLQNVRTQIATSQVTLRSDGSEDPKARYALARQKVRNATENQTHHQRRGSALALLDQLFREQQQSLAEQFTQPLVDTVNGYLQCIFGAKTSGHITWQDGKFQQLALSTSDSGEVRFPFESLSGGAREQCAGAFRLATAEILAAEHNNCLPLIFDDAFAYADPLRVEKLQRMLDLAATRGLQIIVLSCNPTDYAGFGARQTDIDHLG